MPKHPIIELRPLAPGLVLALLAILFGFLLGGVFGLAEDRIKGRLMRSADAVFESAYASDSDRRGAVVAKSWTYLKRAHLHGGAIGTTALTSIILLGLFGRFGPLERISALSLGAGSLLYPSFWLAAGMAAPALGSTDTAKEVLRFIAVPSAGLCLLGLAGTVVSTLQQLGTARRRDRLAAEEGTAS